MKAFETRPYRYYPGANLYVERQAYVFDLVEAPQGRGLDRAREAVEEVFPGLLKPEPDGPAALFANTLLHDLKMDINLSVDRCCVRRREKGWRIAVECVDRRITERCVDAVEAWFNAAEDGRRHDFGKVFGELQQKFDRSLLGGPTIYSLYEGARKRRIGWI